MKIKKPLPGIVSDWQGFSLLELMVVVAILGILAVTAGVYISSDATKLKTFVFNTKSRFNQARFEAVKRGRNVYLDFDFDTTPAGLDNGYTIWVDDNGNSAYNVWNDPWVDDDADGTCGPGEGDCDGDNVCDPGEGDCILDTVVFGNKVSGSSNHGPEIYDGGAAFPTGGPEDPNGGPDGKTISDGVTVGGERFQFKPGGDLGSRGTAYFYFPTGPAGAKTVASGPWAIIVNNVGRIRIDEWRPTSGWQVNQN
jgi:prepilin-type N-terminal cleavage/methylation domain-containing protein